MTVQSVAGKHILITGGAGFIGTHLCRALVEAGARVRVLDIQSPKSPVPGVEYVRGDVRMSDVVRAAVKDTHAVVHFAAVVSVPLCELQPVESYQTNLLGTLVVLEAIQAEMKLSGRKIRLVFASSSAVYGHSGREGRPISENEVSDVPLSLYAAQKLASEQAIRIFGSSSGIPSVIFRFFNVYGLGQDPSSPYSGVISIFASNTAQKKPLLLNGGGGQTRDFVSVRDITQACVLALDLPDDRCDGMPMNLGTGKAITIRGLAETIQKVSGSRVTLDIAPPREGDVLHSCADFSRASRLLGWKPQVELESGLSECLS